MWQMHIVAELRTEVGWFMQQILKELRFSFLSISVQKIKTTKKNNKQINNDIFYVNFGINEHGKILITYNV